MGIKVDYRDWDWLPKAAEEAESYLNRLLAQESITGHSVIARSKLISSFEDKCERKGYTNPRRDVTDTVAARIISYSIIDMERIVDLMREGFEFKEDHNPRDKREDNRRGYDSHHFVVTGESSESGRGWLIRGGHLETYFANFGGLEVQIRTVAAHAWAEFEHARRYKGEAYHAVSHNDQVTVDQLFLAAADARRALDETFVAIEHVLANPTSDSRGGVPDGLSSSQHPSSAMVVDPESLKEYLLDRFPEDEEASDQGLQFACKLVIQSGLESIEALDAALEAVDSEQVRRLMDTPPMVTRVRRLDDELLARFGDDYIRETKSVGALKNRGERLKWKFDRLRGKVKYLTYQIDGEDCPVDLRDERLSAARAVRELARLVGDRLGSEAAAIPDAVGTSLDALPTHSRPREVALAGGDVIWVATNLNRDYSNSLLVSLLGRVADLDLTILSEGDEIGSTRTRDVS